MSFLALIPGIVQGITALVNAYGQIRAAAQQSGEWTPEQEAEFQSTLDQLKTAPQWQPDK